MTPPDTNTSTAAGEVNADSGTFKFLIIFSLSALTLLFLSGRLAAHGGIDGYLQLLGIQTVGIVKMFGYSCTMDAGAEPILSISRGSAEVGIRSFSFLVGPECAAMQIFVVYVAAVIASPVAIRFRVLGIVGGAVAIYIMNSIRVVLLAVLSVHLEDSTLNSIHTAVLPAITIAAVCAIWLIWRVLCERRTKSQHS